LIVSLIDVFVLVGFYLAVPEEATSEAAEQRPEQPKWKAVSDVVDQALLKIDG
jgi:hypothetical protein